MLKLAHIVVLSGPVCAGKSTLASGLAAEYQTVTLKTHDFLIEIQPGLEQQRRVLQEFGEKLDQKTGGTWVREALDKIIQRENYDDRETLVIDSIRIAGQIDALRKAYGRRILHIHLTAPVPILAKRYKHRKPATIAELPTYDAVLANKTEAQVETLREIADVVIDTKRNTASDVVSRVACHIGLHGRDYSRLVDVLVGGEYGSEGKGQIAAYLSPEYELLVRVGGPNAGHSVYEEPEPYIFHHLPSGTRVSRAQLLLGPGAVISERTLLKEIAECGVEYDRLSIDPQAMIISDEDVKNEERLRKTIGSTGQGVGYATARKILGRQTSETKLARDVPNLKPYIRDSCAVLERAFREGNKILLEGTQGTGLSLHHGSYPHVTSRDTTVAGCLAEAGISPSRVRKVVMVCRTYPIRVQSPAEEGMTSGPMSQELSWREISKRSGIPYTELKKHEITSTTKRQRRVAEFDWTLLRKAASLNAPTDIALTFADYLNVKNRKARRFEQLDSEAMQLIDEIERIAAAPVSLVSTRFHHRSIIDRRAW